MNASPKIRSIVLLTLVAIGLTACGSDSDDLDRYINSIKARPGGRIEPLPEIAPYEIFTYIADAEGLRSPFIPDTPQAVAGSAGGGVIKDDDRSPEFLEGFPLDTLRMVGTLAIAKTMYGLIQTSDGLIHRVIPGNYLGQNDGRITDISESKIGLEEIISDGIGGLMKRDAAIGLSD